MVNYVEFSFKAIYFDLHLKILEMSFEGNLYRLTILNNQLLIGELVLFIYNYSIFSK
jgi:hypothetical protein